jgi:hypothetical protein
MSSQQFNRKTQRKTKTYHGSKKKQKSLEENIKDLEEKEDCEFEFSYEKNDIGRFTNLSISVPEFYSGESIEHMLPLLKDHPYLESLHLVWVSDFEEEGHEIFETLATLQAVHTLEVAAPIDHITDAESLLDAVTRMRALRKLDLSQGHLLISEMKTFQEGIEAKRPQIECTFNSDDVEAFAEMYGTKKSKTM